VGYRIELVSRRTDLEIRLRHRFVPRSPEDVAREESVSGLLGEARAAGLPVQLFAAAPQPAEDASKRLVSFAVRLPVAEMAFEDRGDEVEAILELTFVAEASGGTRSRAETIRVPVRIRKTEWGSAPSGIWTHRTTFVSDRGILRFTVTARDVKSNRLGSAETSVRVE